MKRCFRVILSILPYVRWSPRVRRRERHWTGRRRVVWVSSGRLSSECLHPPMLDLLFVDSSREKDELVDRGSRRRTLTWLLTNLSWTVLILLAFSTDRPKQTRAMQVTSGYRGHTQLNHSIFFHRWRSTKSVGRIWTHLKKRRTRSFDETTPQKAKELVEVYIQSFTPTLPFEIVLPKQVDRHVIGRRSRPMSIETECDWYWVRIRNCGARSRSATTGLARQWFMEK